MRTFPITSKIDREIAGLLALEQGRQEIELNLIASENYAPAAILETTASELTNKYAEGYPGKRYYGGCQIVDKVEQLAIDRCKKLFGAEHANVQSHAGSQANMATYAALLKPGETILGMSLAAGGHLTHGHAVNFSGMWYNAVQYGVVPETHRIDYKQVAHLAEQHRPKIIVAGASSYSRFIDYEKFAEIARSVDSYLIVDIAHVAGLIAAGIHPSPVAHADVVTSTTHKTLRGPRGAFILSKTMLKEPIDRAVMPGTQGGPFMNSIAAKAVCFHLATQPDFVAYQKTVVENAQIMAQEFKTLGYSLVADGTDNHLFVLDLRAKKLTGRQAESMLQEVGIAVSRNCIPFDPEKPWNTSGIRIGTPAMSTRGMKSEQAIEIAHLIDEALVFQEGTKRSHIKKAIEALCKKFPLAKLS